MKAISSLQVSLYFLPDDRRSQIEGGDDILAETYASAEIERLRLRRRGMAGYGRELSDDWAAYPDDRNKPESHYLKIEPILNALSAWLQRQTIQDASMGEESATSIYLKVVEQLVAPRGALQERFDANRDDLPNRISMIQKNFLEYARFELVGSFPADKFMSIYQQASNHDRVSIRTVLMPYIEGLEARLDALHETYSVLSNFSKIVNSFLSNKSMQIGIRRGVFIVSESGKAIEPNFLSSGEKQLLMLFSSVVLSRKRSYVFIIDEPELSLNVTWQRRLVKALLSCARGGETQFIMASHSLELITQHRKSTVRLVSAD